MKPLRGAFILAREEGCGLNIQPERDGAVRFGVSVEGFTRKNEITIPQKDIARIRELLDGQLASVLN